MKIIVFGFYSEGNTDYDYLQPLIDRLIQDLVPHYEFTSLAYKTTESTQLEKLVDIAQQAAGVHFVIIHLDADGRDLEQVIKHRFEPGHTAILASTGHINKNLVPVIPIKMTEAWMLVDFEAFKAITYTKLNASALGFPSKPHEVEALNAKSLFEDAVKRCQPKGKGKQLSAQSIYNSLASEVRLEQLRKVPAFIEFEKQLITVLEHLHLLP